MKPILLFIISVITGSATLLSQTRTPHLSLKKGDNIRGAITINSNAVYQKGQQFVTIGTRITKSINYLIDSVSTRGYFLKVKFASLSDSIYGMNQKAHYNDSKSSKTDSSIIADYISQSLNKIDLLEIDKSGVIISLIKDSIIIESKYNYLAQIAGINNLTFKVGSTIDFFSHYSIPQFEKNIEWKDYSTIDNSKSEANCKLIYIDDKSTTVEYSKSTTEKYANTNSNGAESSDRNTGIVNERIVQSRISEYMIVNNSLLAVNRSVAYSASYFLQEIK